MWDGWRDGVVDGRGGCEEGVEYGVLLLLGERYIGTYRGEGKTHFLSVEPRTLIH